jgi:hypothetical protein
MGGIHNTINTEDLMKKRNTWYSDLPWSRQNEIIDAQNRQEFEDKNNALGDSVLFSFPALWRLLTKKRKNLNNTDSEDK